MILLGQAAVTQAAILTATVLVVVMATIGRIFTNVIFLAASPILTRHHRLPFEIILSKMPGHLRPGTQPPIIMLQELMLIMIIETISFSIMSTELLHRLVIKVRESQSDIKLHGRMTMQSGKTLCQGILMDFILNCLDYLMPLNQLLTIT